MASVGGTRKAPAGAIVTLHLDLDGRVGEGDLIETSTGRAYLALAVRVQERGLHVGRQHVTCSVMPRDWKDHLDDLVEALGADARVHRIAWYPRDRAPTRQDRSRG